MSKRKKSIETIYNDQWHYWENSKEYTKNDFMIDLKQQSNLEYDNRNGYKIIPNLKLKDMV
jgi:hypothetical protein